MTRIINKIIKAALSVFARLIKNNSAILKFLFENALKSEIIDYYDNQYYHGYNHVEKAIKLSRKFQFKEHAIIDVGGADGTTAKIFSKAFPNSKIYVFEPLKEHFILIQKILPQFSNIILINKAAGSTSGTETINKTKRITSSSLYQPSFDIKSELFSDILFVENTEKISITTLDETIPQNELITILKLDVQGYELEVLKSANSVISRTNIIILEMINHDYYKGAPKYFELDEYLRMKNFVLYDIFPSTKDDGYLREWDSIYVRKELLV